MQLTIEKLMNAKKERKKSVRVNVIITKL